MGMYSSNHGLFTFTCFIEQCRSFTLHIFCESSSLKGWMNNFFNHNITLNKFNCYPCCSK